MRWSAERLEETSCGWYSPGPSRARAIQCAGDLQVKVPARVDDLSVSEGHGVGGGDVGSARTQHMTVSLDLICRSAMRPMITRSRHRLWLFSTQISKCPSSWID